MQYSTAEELYVVMHHLPLQVVATSCPVVVVDGLVAIDGNEVLLRIGGQLAVEVRCRDYRLLVLGEAAGRLLDDGEDLEHHLVEGFFVDFESFFLNLVYLCKNGLALIDGCVLNGCLELCNLLFLFVCRLLYLLLDGLGAGTQLVVRQGFYLCCERLGFLHQRLYGFHVAR